jgi:hypothetical protein
MFLSKYSSTLGDLVLNLDELLFGESGRNSDSIGWEFSSKTGSVVLFSFFDEKQDVFISL